MFSCITKQRPFISFFLHKKPKWLVSPMEKSNRRLRSSLWQLQVYNCWRASILGSRKISRVNITFYFTRREPIRKQKLINTFLMLWLRLFRNDGIGRYFRLSQKFIGKIKKYKRELSCVVVELKFAAFISCMRRKFMKLMHERKLNNKEIQCF